MADLYTQPGAQLAGARQLRASLRRAGVDITQLKEVNAEAAGIVARAATGTVPRRPGSGALAATIRHSGTLTAGIVRAGNNRTSASGVRYANPIHWGWFKRHIKPNPFLAIAAHAHEPEWVALYFEKLQDVLDKIEGDK